MAKRRLSEEDLALWKRIAANVAPLKHAAKLAPRKPAAPSAAPAKPKPAAPNPAPPAAKPSPPPPIEVHTSAPAAPGLDRRTTARLRRGHIAIEAKLDLHGMTQGEAHEELRRFIAESRERGRRCVIVVTGTGTTYRREGGAGVLRRAVPRWLAEPALREAVLSFAPAEPRHGGQGALYVLLRRRR